MLMPANELLQNLLALFFLVFGSLLGSFCNVVILRMSSKTSVIFPPSSCPKCGHRLHAIDLLPIFSWLSLRGKCRYCQVAISWQYPVVELCIALLLAGSYLSVGLNLKFIALAGKAVIWFVATVIFIRREVLEPGPYIWPAMIFILFNFPLHGCPFLSLPVKAAPLIAFIIAAIASFRLKYLTYSAWAGLTFLFLFALAPRLGFYAAAPVALVAVAAALFPARTQLFERIFAGLQLTAIVTMIFYG